MKAGAFELSASYGVELPSSYVGFTDEIGPGTLGGFLHFQPPAYLSTYRERMAPFMDDELEVALTESGEVLILLPTVTTATTAGGRSLSFGARACPTSYAFRLAASMR